MFTEMKITRGNGDTTISTFKAQPAVVVMVRPIPPPLDRIPSLINSAHERDPSPTQPTITHQQEKNYSCDSIHEPRPLHALTKKDLHAQTKEKNVRAKPKQKKKSVRAPSSPERTSPETPVPPLDGRIVAVRPHPPEPVRPHRSQGRCASCSLCCRRNQQPLLPSHAAASAAAGTSTSAPVSWCCSTGPPEPATSARRLLLHPSPDAAGTSSCHHLHSSLGLPSSAGSYKNKMHSCIHDVKANYLHYKDT